MGEGALLLGCQTFESSLLHVGHFILRSCFLFHKPEGWL